ncbi:dihydrodipicolinate synthase family protein [Paenibacillus sp. GXUN7292]|uniref:dihydrodipicolinate synthase family protein n=1 Tax=Paenibacillus sp. GXUN7292 TaxID=3422499 RepID=UPI003D7ECE03
MNKQLPNGVFPTMITPFTASNEVDYTALEKLVEWYIQHKVDGLFAVCQSSEMFKLSLDERVELARFIMEKAKGRVPVIASGHIADTFEEQVKELKAMCGTGIDALVLITNRLVQQHESDDMFKGNLERLLKHIPEHIPLGFYECPSPYKRVMSPSLLRWCAETGRFFFLKDTSCDMENITEKLEAVQGTGLKIYNANTATLLDSLKLGIAGYSGVMANFHPELYVWLTRNYSDRPVEAKQLSDQLSMASLIEKQLYPVNAKYYQMLEGNFTNNISRTQDYTAFTPTHRLEVEQLQRLSKRLAAQLPDGK